MQIKIKSAFVWNKNLVVKILFRNFQLSTFNYFEGTRYKKHRKLVLGTD